MSSSLTIYSEDVDDAKMSMLASELKTNTIIQSIVIFLDLDATHKPNLMCDLIAKVLETIQL